MTIREAVMEHGGATAADVDSLVGLEDFAQKNNLKVDDNASYGNLLVQIFEEVAEAKLIQPTFMTGYPIEVSPLARKNDKNGAVVDRFELYIGGRELANAFSELNDPADQRQRFMAQMDARAAGDEEANPIDDDYVRALEYGMPPAAGEGIGVDRLVMLLTNSPSIRDVILSHPSPAPLAVSTSMNYELFIGLRYLRARRRETFISLITVISILGVMLAVMTLNVVMSVMSGFEETLRDRLLGIDAHIALVRSGEPLRDYEKLLAEMSKEPGVIAATPTIYGQVMMTSGSRVSGVVVRGVDPDRVNAVINIQSFLRQGTLAGLTAQHPLQVEDRTVSLPGIILGERLANQLGVFPGSPVQVVSPLGSPTAIGMIPKVRRFMVAGILRTGMSEIDQTLVFMGLSEAQKFFELPNAVTNIEMRVKEVDQSRQIADRIQRRLGFPYFAEDWTRLWPNLFSALQLEKTVYFLVLLLMVLIGAFNIVSTLVMVVMEKKKDIAILRSMGATQQSIRKIFLLKGFLIGVIGTILGVVLGLLVCGLISQYQFKLPDGVFLISTVPVRIYLGNFVLVAVASFVVCLIASIYPARQAAKLDPVEIIRYE